MSNGMINDSGLWRIRLFGGVEVTTPNGTVVCITSKKTGELLAYLALHPGRTHSREKLVDIIWGDSDVGDARARLRQEILTLRSLIAPADESSTPLDITKSSCGLNPETLVDALRFEQACHMARQEIGWDTKRRLYHEAVSLYTSDLLPGYDAGWIIGERARFSQQYSRALLDLAEAQRKLGDYSGVEQSLGMLLSHDPLSEECHIALMRLYAELGQPTRVQQQFQTMKKALREGLGVEPTAGSLKLLEELREAAGHRASELAISTTESRAASKAVSVAASLPATLRTPYRPSIPTLEPSAQKPITQARLPRKSFLRPVIVVLAVVVISVGLIQWRATHTVRSGSAPHSLVEHNMEKWTYIYQPRPGEKPNSEGSAILADETTVYVTGLVQTEKDDTDILTLRLSRAGKVLWVDRYSSPEHDCDRAFSIAHDGKQGIFVAGETYVPPHFEDAEGWHLVLLHYSQNGERLWVRRSPMVRGTEGEGVQVGSDSHGGCFLASSAVENGRRLILVLRYDASGNLLWRKTIAEGSGTVFGRLVVDSVGDLFLCGTVRRGETAGNENNEWMAARLDPDARVKWVRFEHGPAPGDANSAARITIDHGGNVIVGGVFSTVGDVPDKGLGQRLAVQKYSPDGVRIWQRVLKESGPTVLMDCLSVNTLGDVIVGGTERRLDGNWGIVLARYDAFGSRTEYSRHPNPPGYPSAALKALYLRDDGQTTMFTEVSKSDGADMRLRNSVAETQRSPDGEVLHNWLFESSPQSINYVRDCSVFPFLAVTGQTGTLTDVRELMVLNY